MGLSSALAIAMSGLSANQAALSIVSGNVANANTPGYVVQTPNQIELATGGSGSSVQVTGVNRQLDLYVQSQLRTETAGGAYADQTANILGQLQGVYGTPGGTGTLEASYSNFTTALQALSTSQGSASAQTTAMAAAQSLAQGLNQTSQGIQSLRSNVQGQHRPDPDCEHQPAAAGLECDRSRGGDADGSARRRDQRSVDIDGCQCRYRYGQPGQRLHKFGHAARRRLTRVQDEFLFAGVADG
jgi:hypothetical protein